MTFINAIRRVLSLMAIVSLLFGPLSAPVAAGGSGVSGIASSRTPMTMAPNMPSAIASSANMGEMPCCPPEEPALPDCQKGCPLMVLCMAKIVSGLPVGTGIPTRVGIVTQARWIVAASFASVAQIPPAEPPRS